jgi:hypothetical protein
MTHDPLATYLEDHLAGATGAIELLGRLRDQHAGDRLGALAAQLLEEIEADHAVLEALAARVGQGSSVLKDATAWIGAKVSRLKLGGLSDDLGLLEALETLALGILGKRALWCALAVIAPTDGRLAGLDLAGLIARAESQHDRVEDERRRMAAIALRAAPEGRDARRPPASP